MKHMKGMTAITNPLINSYKRFVPGYEAPIYIAWSATNRSPLIRIPTPRKEETRIELRCPDPSANPYLAFAVCLAAGLDGIENKIVPPEGVHGNVFELTQEDIEKLKIEELPQNLFEAIKELQKDDYVKSVLGDLMVSKIVAAKMDEWTRYREQISQWEIDQYLYKI